MRTLSQNGRRLMQAWGKAGLRYDDVPMKGGWDQVTPILMLPPGMLRDVQNFEVAVTGGYARIGGYERLDGHAKPSNATYGLVQVTSFTNVPSTSQILTGQTSGATGTIIAVVNTATQTYMALTQITGSFSTSEVVAVGATMIGTTTAQTVSLTAQQNAQYLNLAADVYRALIAAVPGSGPVRGVVHILFTTSDHIYAFRDNAGGTATVMYESSASGWTAVTFYNEVSFTAGGTTEPADGETLTQGGVTATIKRSVQQSGSWAGGTAAGRFIVTNPSGGNFAAGAATASGGAAVTLSGAQTAITLLTGGKFEFERANFAGTLGTRRLYGCDGVNRGFEFDGSVFVPITTGTSTDTPKHVREHKNHLFFAFQTSAIHSAIGKPYKWTTTDGASELACGDTVTNFMRQAGNQTSAALEITCLEKTLMLYGNTVADWLLVPYKEGVGAQHYSVQNLGRTYVLDRNGVIDLVAVQAYGNFVQSTLTYGIQTFINDKIGRLNYSCVSRTKSQYRLFFNDGSALYLTMIDSGVTDMGPMYTAVQGRFVGGTQVVFPTAFYCACSSTLANGQEIILVGSASDGFVYEMDKGSSFDGANIEAYLTFNWNSMKSPRILKDFYGAALEIQGNFYASLSVAYTLGYGKTDYPTPDLASYTSNLGSQANWDSATWDAFVWDGLTLIPSEIDLRGCAENVQVRISSSTDYIYPFTIASMMTGYIPRRALRGQA